MFIVPLLVGAIFGAALVRGRVHENSLIIGQMTMEHFVMLKMFLAACATSMIGFALLEALRKETTRENVTAKFHRGVEAVVIGASMLGMGMAITGSCPGTVFAQIGAGSYASVLIYVGGLAGSYVFSKTNHMLPLNKTKLSVTSVHSWVGSSVRKTSFMLGGGLLAFVFLLELLVPWKQDIASIQGKGVMSIVSANPPSVSGIMIGLAQLTLQLLLQKTLGSSTSYSFVVGSCMGTTGSEYLSNCVKNFRWQFFVMIGVTVGAYIAANIGDITFVGLPVTHTVLAKYFVGGFMMIYGAQMAGGCTSGHGLSGFGFLSTYSVIAVACMFGTGILTGCFIKFLT